MVGSVQSRKSTRPRIVQRAGQPNGLRPIGSHPGRGKGRQMKTVTIAFDCDGTLITTFSGRSGKIVANERIRSLLVALASFKNTKIIVWSGSGELWARQVGAAIGIDKYVDLYTTKNHLGFEDGEHKFAPEIQPDIAIDDIQACELGLLNLIVREK